MLTVAMAITTAVLLMIFRYQLTGLYSSDVPLRLFAAQLVVLAALFQLSDGAQVALLGMLRGLNDTRVPMLINAFSYWVIAFTAGYYAAHHLGWGAKGLWGGLILGLSVASLLLLIRLRVRLNQVAEELAPAGK